MVIIDTLISQDLDDGKIGGDDFKKIRMGILRLLGKSVRWVVSEKRSNGVDIGKGRPTNKNI